MKILTVFFVLLSSMISYAGYDEMSCRSDVTGATFRVEYDRRRSQTRFEIGPQLAQSFRRQGVSRVAPRGLARAEITPGRFTLSSRYFSGPEYVLRAQSEGDGVRVEYHNVGEREANYYFHGSECVFR